MDRPNGAVVIFGISLGIVAAALAGCTGGEGGTMGSTGTPGTSQSPAIVNGVATKGPLSGAVLSFFQVTAQGRRGALLATARADDGGRFSTPLSMSTAGPVWVEANVSRYRDEALQRMVSLPSSRLVTFCIPLATPGVTTTAPLTPFNHMAFMMVNANGGISTARMQAALAGLTSALGADVSSVAPADLSTMGNVRAAFGAGGTALSTPQLLMGIYMAGMSQRASQLGTDAIDYMMMLGHDYEDGQLDGIVRGQGPIPGLSSVEMTLIRSAASVYATHMTSGMLDVMMPRVLVSEMVTMMGNGGQPTVDPGQLPGLVGGMMGGGSGGPGSLGGGMMGGGGGPGGGPGMMN